MGYSLFANRKVYYTNLVYELQTKLDNITAKKQSLLNFSANISDGTVTVEELAGDPSNYANYVNFLNGIDEYIDTSNEDGGVADTISDIGSIAMDTDDSEEYLAEIAELLNTAVDEDFAEQYCKKLEAIENQLDVQQQKIETQITAAQSALTAAQEAEGEAIENATPKFSGVQ